MNGLVQVHRPAADHFTIFDTNWSPLDPADATTYYWSLGTLSPSTPNYTPMFFANDCEIFRMDIMFVNAGTLGSNETSTIYLRTNNTTDNTITTSVVNDSALTKNNVTGLSIAVAAGDYLDIKWTTPTWTTNPTTVYFGFCLHARIV